MVDLRTLGDLVTQLSCLQLWDAPEIFGPTDVNAQSGNQSLSVGLNRDGTVSVFRWPRPSFYDQIKYTTTDRDRPRFGAAPNAGAFLGLSYDADAPGRETVWLREMDTEQRYAHNRSDAVVTEHRAPDLGLAVTVVDVVARDVDALVRDVTVERAPDSRVADVDLVAFENYNLVVSKHPRNPVQDWCLECQNTDRAVYRPGLDAVVHTKAGVDQSTDDHRRVATGMAFAAGSSGHQVGGDAYESAAESDLGAAADAYVDASDGDLRGNDSFEGHTTAALSRRLDFAPRANGDRRTEATATVILAAAQRETGVAATIESVRDRSPAGIRREKRAWFDDLVGDAPMPDTDDDAVVSAAWRTLVTLVTNYDPESGAIVASIATQSPYALDWPRDGAYFNHLLDAIGLEEWVADRNRWYADLQERPGTPADNTARTPAGNWAMNYYGDGVVGGPIPWEIDQTGFTAWTLWDHYDVTGDLDYLRDVYPAIRRAAEFLVDYRDPGTGLHRPAYEDDHVLKSQTAVGAGAVWLGLDAAASAAAELDRTDDAGRFRERRDELADAIETHLWDGDAGAYSDGSPGVTWLETLPYVSDVLRELPLFPDTVADPALYWPVAYRPHDHPRMERHLNRLWRHISPSFGEPELGRHDVGFYEAKGLVGLAQAWRDDPHGMARVRRGVRWIVRENATDDTGILGEAWMRRGDDIVPGVSQPHAWSHLLVYYASLEAFPPADVPDLDPGESAVEYVRRRVTADSEAGTVDEAGEADEASEVDAPGQPES